MDPVERELHDLRQEVAALSERVRQLEQRTTSAQPRTVTPPLAQKPRQAPLAVRPPKESLESRIGSQWLNRVGIIAVLFGVSFFLKYAFENNWIGAGGRISIGLLCGIAIVLWSERFRAAGHLVFSWSLKAVGVGSLYLSLWAAFQLYHLLPAGVAFFGMVVVTAVTAAMSLTQNAQVLAAFALIGGFATPLLLSTGENHEIALFSYVTLLNVGTLVLIAFRPWRRLLAGAFAGTVILFTLWTDAYYTRTQLSTTLFFLTVFFAVFAVAPLLAQLRLLHQRVETPAVFPSFIVLPLLNAAAYFAATYALLSDISKAATAWIAIALSATYIGLSRQFQQRLATGDPNRRILSSLHIALAVGFLTTAIPLRLSSHWITIGWLVEAAVLGFIAYRLSNNLLKALSLAAFALGLLRLVFFERFHPAHLLFNARFTIYLLAIAILALGASLAHRFEKTEYRAKIAGTAIILLNVLALLALNLEAHDYFLRQIAAMDHVPGQPHDWANLRGIGIVRDFTYSAIWMLYGAALMWVGFRKRSAFLRWQSLFLLAVTVIKVFIFDTSQLERGYRIIAFIALGALLLGVSFVYQRDWLQLSTRRPNRDTEGNSPSA